VLTVQVMCHSKRTSESKKRKGVMKLSNEGVRAVQHSRTAFQRLAIARGSYECLDYAEKHCSRLDQDSLMENVELILEELRGRDNPNYVATPSSILHAARNLEGEEEEKIDLHERLDRVAHARKREILASLERKEKMKRARSASVQYRSIRRGSTMRHKSLSNVGCAMQPFSPSAPSPYPLFIRSLVLFLAPAAKRHALLLSPEARRGRADCQYCKERSDWHCYG
jgi:hypothetical protein